MARLLRLLTGIYMCLALGLGGVAHAAEDSGSPIAEFCVAFGCAEQAAERHLHNSSTQHGQDHGSDDACTCHAHGGCHGHHQLGSVKDHHLPLQPVTLALPHGFDSEILPLSIRALMLRPPIA
ncbi:hypothetical protein GRI97_00685 [Altererythrobacter xixiisoli]|uniref:DUF2946 domain-containing protein n=1 Tax=Croceibacterium xixiisoli TaxID=1476466 RepID=A0A6I4TT08_9SPHN|nr:hypothetical protein [Croceibacterium xixiisoli]MXO97503.1 hypothetical protein [Croceibacterium xixiisoli]